MLAGLGLGFQYRASELPENGESQPASSMSTIVAGMLCRLTGSVTTRPAEALPGTQDEKWDVNFLAVQASAMSVETVLAQFFAMVGRDNEKRVIEEVRVCQARRIAGRSERPCELMQSS